MAVVVELNTIEAAVRNRAEFRHKVPRAVVLRSDQRPIVEEQLIGEPRHLGIHVDDFGEGMDEAIIDAQLTRMFSSTKENDLTKIGKFGIGFLFAMYMLCVRPALTF